MNEVVEIEEAEKQRMIKKCEKIVKHGINVFIDRQLIYNLPEQVRFAHSLRAFLLTPRSLYAVLLGARHHGY